MKHLRILSEHYIGYTGPIGSEEFVDGVSVNPLSRAVRDRLSTSFDFIEIDEDGDEKRAGTSQRLIDESAFVMPVAEPTERQTDEEKIAENSSILFATLPDKPIYTITELQAIADKQGILGLREIATPWGVKNRSIPLLIEMIIGAQDIWLNERNKSFEMKRKSLADLEADAVASRLATEKAFDNQDKITPVEVPADDATSSGDDFDEDDLSVPEEIQSPSLDAISEAAATGNLATGLTE